MSKPKTIHTIKSLLARTVDVGQCNEWTGYFRNKTPAVFHEGKIHAVRRVMRQLQNKPIPKGYFLAPSCGNCRCISPYHITERTPQEHAKAMAEQVDHFSASRLLKLTERAQVRRKLTDEQLNIILMSDFPARQLAAEFSVNQSLISRIRRGQAHRMSAARNNPFFRLLG